MSVLECFLEDTKPFSCEKFDEAKFIVVGAPLDNSITYRPGTRFAPDSIREASCNIEFYSISLSKTVEDLKYNDLGNIIIVPGDNIASLKRIKDVITGVKEKYSKCIPIILGGEHTITYAAVKALADTSIGVVVLDAHLDLRDDYLGYRYSHATVVRRITEMGIKPFIIGVRAVSREELEFASINGIRFIRSMDVDEKFNELIDYTRMFNKIYISIDIDVIDPGYAPGVSCPEPFGLSPHQLLRVLERVIREANSIIGIDVVEVNPLVDINGVTSILAAKIIIEATALINEYVA